MDNKHFVSDFHYIMKVLHNDVCIFLNGILH